MFPSHIIAPSTGNSSIPAPVKEIFALELFTALVLNIAESLNVAAASGINQILKVRVRWVSIVIGNLALVVSNLNFEDEKLHPFKVNGWVPWFVILKVKPLIEFFLLLL